MSHTWVKMKTLTLDPRIQRDEGDLGQLTDSIIAHGLMDPVIVSKKGLLLSGWRRVKVFDAMGVTNIPAIVIDSFLDAVPLISGEGNNPAYTKEMVWSEKIRRMDLWEEFYRPEVLERHRLGRLKAAQTKKTGAERARSRNYPLATGIVVSSLFGIGRSTFERTRNVYRTSIGEDNRWDQDLAKQLMEALDAGTLVPAQAYRALIAGVAPEQLKPKESGSRTSRPRPRGQDGAMQRMVLENAAATSRGLAMALQDLGELNGNIEKDEASRWAADLIQARRVIAGTIKSLRRRIDG